MLEGQSIDMVLLCMHVGSVTVSYILVQNSYRPRVFLSMFCKTVIKHYIHLHSRIGQHISKHYHKTARQYSFKKLIQLLVCSWNS